MKPIRREGASVEVVGGQRLLTVATAGLCLKQGPGSWRRPRAFTGHKRRLSLCEGLGVGPSLAAAFSLARFAAGVKAVSRREIPVKLVVGQSPPTIATAGLHCGKRLWR
eukprot:3251744-Alexandrium_andersonii.AAC.1